MSRDETAAPKGGCSLVDIVMRNISFSYVFGRPGSDLLFQALRLSTIGAEEFNGRVRDGIGFRLLAKTTRSAKDVTSETKQSVGLTISVHATRFIEEANGH